MPDATKTFTADDYVKLADDMIDAQGYCYHFDEKHGPWSIAEDARADLRLAAQALEQAAEMVQRIADLQKLATQVVADRDLAWRERDEALAQLAVVQNAARIILRGLHVLPGSP